jgi:hypothetical protein
MPNLAQGEIIEELVEVETGKGSDALDRRPVLAEALALAKRTKAAVCVAKLDRPCLGHVPARGTCDTDGKGAPHRLEGVYGR